MISWVSLEGGKTLTSEGLMKVKALLSEKGISEKKSSMLSSKNSTEMDVSAG